MVRGKLVFIAGGVRSGKTSFAEDYLMNEQAKRYVYVASGVAVDEEMKQRIERHRQDRAAYQKQWVTIEQPRHIEQLPFSIKKGDAILWDCITTWLSNELYVADMERVEKQLLTTMEKLLMQVKVLVIVSNEVLDEQLSEYDGVLLYQKWIGRIHQALVAMADEAYEMDYGLVRQWK